MPAMAIMAVMMMVVLICMLLFAVPRTLLLFILVHSCQHQRHAAVHNPIITNGNNTPGRIVITTTNHRASTNTIYITRTRATGFTSTSIRGRWGGKGSSRFAISS